VCSPVNPPEYDKWTRVYKQSDDRLLATSLPLGHTGDHPVDGVRRITSCSTGRGDDTSILAASSLNPAGRDGAWAGPGIFFDASPMYRISRDGQEPVVDVDRVERIELALVSCAAGRYHVDQISRDPLPSVRSRRSDATPLLRSVNERDALTLWPPGSSTR
jgi:hypothetical protein